MTVPFEGKVVAITGAASGMGLATAHLLASRGALLSLADINGTALRKAAASLPFPEKHMQMALDVRKSSDIDAWISSTVQRFSKIDGAVNMAGILAPRASIVDTSDEQWDRTLTINARGVLACLRAQLRVMSKGGSIVSAASVWGQFGVIDHVSYSASKAAVIAMTRTAAKENPQIRVNCVSPGSVNTPLAAGVDPEHGSRGSQHTVQKRKAEAIEVARVIAFLLSDEASFVTGAVYNVDGGWLC